MITTDPNTAPPEKRKHSHYHKDISHLDTLDIYRVCDLFITNDPSGALAHAAKKILVAGGRGAKDIRKDLQEAIDTLQRKLEMLDEDAERDAPLPFFGFDLASSPDSADAFAYMFGGVQDAWQKSFIIPSEWMHKERRPGRSDLWMRHREWLEKPIAQEMQMRAEAAAAAMLQEAQQLAESLTGAPWYPPANTAWVEVPGHWREKPAVLDPDEIVEVLLQIDRDERNLRPSRSNRAKFFDWSRQPTCSRRIVAYRIIKGQSK